MDERLLKEELKKDYVAGLKGKSDDFKYYVSIDLQNSDDEREFGVYGNRLIAFLCRRFEHHTNIPLEYQSVLEIGCGMGRMVKPLAHRFDHVVGVDISAEALEEAKKYLSSTENVSLLENDGTSLNGVETSSLDCVVTTGVFQHIPSREILQSYIEEAIRVLKPDGLFQFTFQAFQKNIEGKGGVGAKMTADWLNKVFSGLNAQLLEMTFDIDDYVPHITVIVRKTIQPFLGDFRRHELQHIAWRTDCWRGLETKAHERERQFNGERWSVTFYDPE